MKECCIVCFDAFVYFAAYEMYPASQLIDAGQFQRKAVLKCNDFCG